MRRRVSASAPAQRWSRRRGVLGVFAAFAAVGFVAAYIGPTGVALSQANAEERQPITLYSSTLGDVQSLQIERAADGAETAAVGLDRGGYTVYVTPTPTPTPEPVVAEASESSSSTPSWAPAVRHSRSRHRAGHRVRDGASHADGATISSPASSRCGTRSPAGA